MLFSCGNEKERLQRVKKSKISVNSVKERTEDSQDSKLTIERKPQKSINLDSQDMETFLKWYLVPNIEIMYQKAFNGSPDDHFWEMEQQLAVEYPFLFQNEVTGWESFLSKTDSLLQAVKSTYKIRFHMIQLEPQRIIPSVTIYKLLGIREERAPVEDLSKFWQIDFSEVYPDTTFLVEYGETPLVLRYDLWIQKNQQELQLEAITYQGTNDIIIFIDGPFDTYGKKKRSLIHEFSHILFWKKANHLTEFELAFSEIVVEQAVGPAHTSVSFSYYEFDELMAKLSELLVLPDDELYDYIHDVRITKMPHYQMMRQQISSTTVYRYMADEYPDRFEELRYRGITSEEIEYYLKEMANQTTEDGVNRLRSYLLFHVKNLIPRLANVVFE